MNIKAIEKLSRSAKQLRLFALNRLGGKCVRCGEKDPDGLVIDFIDLKLCLMGVWVWWDAIARGERLDEFQVLCGTCYLVDRAAQIEKLLEYWMSDPRRCDDLHELCVYATQLRPSPGGRTSRFTPLPRRPIDLYIDAMIEEEERGPASDQPGVVIPLFKQKKDDHDEEQPDE